MKQLIYQLELSLLEPSVRQSAAKLDELLSNDFVEFSSTGKIYHKKDILEWLPSEAPKNFTVLEFDITELSKQVILATYTVSIDSVISLRSSIWKYHPDRWCIVFHQGTLIPVSP